MHKKNSNGDLTNPGSNGGSNKPPLPRQLSLFKESDNPLLAVLLELLQGLLQRMEKVEQRLLDACSKAKAYLQPSVDALSSEFLRRFEELDKTLQECLARIHGQPPPPPADKEYLTTFEAAAALDLKPETVRQYANEKKIRGNRASSGRGGKKEWRFHRDEIKRFLAEGPDPDRDPPYRHVK